MENQTETWELTSRPANLDARSSKQAEYPDGAYTFYASAYDVDYDHDPNLASEQKEVKIVVDNFKPFIEKVEAITNMNDPTIARVGYSRSWLWNSATFNQTLGDDQATNEIYEAQDLTILVVASEPMRQIRLSIPSLNVFNSVMQSAPQLGERTYTFRIPNVTTAGNHPITFEATSTDLVGNEITSYPQEIPYRNDAGSWVNQSAEDGDVNHAIFIEPATCWNQEGGRVASTCATIADFTYSISTINPLRIDFLDASVPPDNVVAWDWDFGDPDSGLSNASAQENPFHVFSTPGVYTVTLTVVDVNNATDVHSKQIAVGSTTYGVSFTASTTTGNVPVSVNLSGSTNIPDVTSWEWVVTPTTNQSFSPDRFSQNTNLNLNAAGTYEVRLRVTSGGNTYTSTSQFIYAGSSLQTVAQFTWKGQPYAYAPIYFNDNSFVSGGCETANSVWTITPPFGSGVYETTATGAPFTYYPQEVGTYAVTLCVQDMCGSNACVTKSVDVLLKTNTIQADFTASRLTIKKGESIEFRDVTQDPQNKIAHRGWWFQHVPNTDWNSCQEPYCYERGDFYPGVFTYTYNTPGTYEVRLMVHEDIGYPGLSKTITIVVEDNALFEMQNYSSGSTANNISIAGDFAAIYNAGLGSIPELSVLRRTADTWSKVAILNKSGGWGNQGKVVMDNNTIAVKTSTAIYIYEQPANGWANMSNPTRTIALSNTEPWKFDLSENYLVTIVQPPSQTRRYADIYERENGVWGTTPTQRINLGDLNALDVALDNGTLVVQHYTTTSNNVLTLSIYDANRITGFVYKDQITKNNIDFG